MPEQSMGKQEHKARVVRIDQAIAQLESLNSRDGSAAGLIVTKGRGRRSMSPEEREEVSVRMRRYWAARRKIILD